MAKTVAPGIATGRLRAGVRGKGQVVDKEAALCLLAIAATLVAMLLAGWLLAL
jgi:hypothetical protein